MVAITPIPNNPQTTSLNGTEVVPGVQSGATVKIPLSQIASYVLSVISSSIVGVLSFNGRVGVVSLISGDVTGVGGALLASPTFTGAPTVPTAAPGDNTAKIANTAFVTAAVIASTSGVASFNTRTGAVTLASGDITAASGALLASPTFTGTPAAPTAALNTNTTQIATAAFVLGQASTTTPLVDGSAAVGTDTTWARSDHVHPSDTTRLALTGGTLSGALTVSQTLGIVGTTTNNNANTGAFGEYVSATLSTPFGLSNLLRSNVTSINLTAGDWDVEGVVNFDASAHNDMQFATCGVSSTAVTLPAVSAMGCNSLVPATGNFTTAKLPTGAARFSLSTTTTIYLVAQTAYSTGPVNVVGTIRARRVR